MVVCRCQYPKLRASTLKINLGRCHLGGNALPAGLVRCVGAFSFEAWRTAAAHLVDTHFGLSSSVELELKSSQVVLTRADAPLSKNPARLEAECAESCSTYQAYLRGPFVIFESRIRSRCRPMSSSSPTPSFPGRSVSGPRCLQQPEVY